MTSYAAFECNTHGRYHSLSPAQLEHVANPVTRYGARDPCPISPACSRVSIPSPSEGFAGHARRDSSQASDRHFRSRVFLAPPPRMHNGVHAQDTYSLLAAEVRGEHKKRQDSCAPIGTPGVDVDRRLGLRDGRSERPFITPCQAVKDTAPATHAPSRGKQTIKVYTEYRLMIGGDL